MKFLVDAQLPARLARFLSGVGHDVLHTLELPGGNCTIDVRIAEVADGSDRVVVTKDRDFGGPRGDFWSWRPAISATMPYALFAKHLDVTVAALDESDFVELGPDTLVVHRRRGDEPLP